MALNFVQWLRKPSVHECSQLPEMRASVQVRGWVNLKDPFTWQGWNRCVDGVGQVLCLRTLLYRLPRFSSRPFFRRISAMCRPPRAC